MGGLFQAHRFTTFLNRFSNRCSGKIYLNIRVQGVPNEKVLFLLSDVSIARNTDESISLGHCRSRHYLPQERGLLDLTNLKSLGRRFKGLIVDDQN